MICGSVATIRDLIRKLAHMTDVAHLWGDVVEYPQKYDLVRAPDGTLLSIDFKESHAFTPVHGDVVSPNRGSPD
jgi:hypothetical protein